MEFRFFCIFLLSGAFFTVSRKLILLNLCGFQVWKKIVKGSFCNMENITPASKSSQLFVVYGRNPRAKPC